MERLSNVVKCSDLLLFPRVCISRLYVELGRNCTMLEGSIDGASITASGQRGLRGEALLD